MLLMLCRMGPALDSLLAAAGDTEGQGNVVGYNAQVDVDARHKLIAAEDVTNDVADYRQRAPVALDVKDNLALQQIEAVADKSYYNTSEVRRCVEQDITPLLPKADTSANARQGLFGKSKFRCDAQNNVSVCPHFLLKGLEKVRAEWSLMTLVYNPKRVLSLVSAEKLIAAVN